MLLEREEPLALLDEAVSRARSGEGRIVLIGSEAGMGKTSLVRAFAAGPHGANVHVGGSEALSTPRALGPLKDMAARVDAKLSELLMEGATQDKVFACLLSVLQSKREPQVLVFEDVHWADNATLDLVKYLGRRIAFLPALLILTFRSDEIGPEHPFAQVLGDMPSGSTLRIQLRPLSLAAVAELTRASAEEATRIFELTNGNPFYVSELAAAGGEPASPLPASIRDAVWARLQRLSENEKTLLEVISISPVGAESWFASSLAGRPFEAELSACEGRGLLVRHADGLYRFRHELARAATLERLTPSAQSALHAAAVRALEERGSPSLARMVHHAAAAGDGGKVISTAPVAAREAAAVGAHREAAMHLAAALTYASFASSEVLAQIYEDWAYEAGLSLKIDEDIIAARKKAIAFWREQGRKEKVALNLRWLSRLHWYRGEAALAHAYVDEAVSLLEGEKPTRELAMAWSTRSQMFMLNDRTDEAIDWGERALELARVLGDHETEAHALNNLASARMFSGRSGGEPLMEQSLAIALKHGLHEQAARAYTNYGEYAVVSRQFALAERLLADGIAFDTRHDLDAWTHYLAGRLAQLRLEQGRFAEAHAIATEVLNRENQTLVMRLPSLTVLALCKIRTDSAGGGHMIREALRDSLATGEQQNIVPARLGLIEWAWLNDRPEIASMELTAMADLRVDAFDPWEFGAFSVWWRRCGMAGAPPLAGRRIDTPHAAELAGKAEAAALEWDRLGLPYEACLALLADSASYGRAVERLADLGAQPAAALARRLAAARGIPVVAPKRKRGPYAAAKRHPFGLTAREAQIFALIAEGNANASIAQSLGLSNRTVEHHVSSLLAKLQVRNRIDLLLKLRSEPWLKQQAAE